ncbi:aldo/keto reductase [Novosphingobium flavum]|uniref:Aldo/keto reductase n=2 Tax=Novosphingobium flavum TaxID=1778672 RepID=A0A7X1FRX9_9SPHN|nr:aldo/keto reductase [Novosphingobium flavum]MBC2665856.1 aldo/keto reductase [Novosphingobium flavum]
MLERIEFGRNGLEASVAGLGCGGYSRLGAGNGLPPENAVMIVRKAIELGVNFIDTSPSYENEAQVGEAIAPVREQIILSTKFSTLNKPGAAIDGAGLRRSLEASLQRLGTDYVDVLSIQSVTLATYDHVCNEMLPVLQDMKRDGLVRNFGLTEWFYDDTTHQMSERALADGHWDYLLLGFNLLNQSARRKVLPLAAETKVGVAVMFAVRRALSDKEALRKLVAALVARGDLSGEGIDLDDPLGFLMADGDCASVVEAAYRYARHESMGGVILTGTGNAHHLAENVKAIGKGPLPRAHVERLETIFGALDNLTGQEIVDDAGVIHKKHVPGKPKGH